MLGAASLLVFLLMLILVAKGYTITRGRLSLSSSVKMAVFMAFYTLTYVILLVFEAKVRVHDEFRYTCIL